MIKYNEFYKNIQEIVIQEAHLRRDKELLLSTMTIPNMNETEIEAVSNRSLPIVLPDLNNIYNDHLKYLNDETKQKSLQSSKILHSNSN